VRWRHLYCTLDSHSTRGTLRMAFSLFIRALYIPRHGVLRASPKQPPHRTLHILLSRRNHTCPTTGTGGWEEESLSPLSGVRPAAALAPAHCLHAPRVLPLRDLHHCLRRQHDGDIGPVSCRDCSRGQASLGSNVISATAPNAELFSGSKILQRNTTRTACTSLPQPASRLRAAPSRTFSHTTSRHLPRCAPRTSASAHRCAWNRRTTARATFITRTPLFMRA